MNPRPDALHADAGLAQHDVAGLKLDYLTPEEFVRLLLGRSVIGPGYCCVPNAHQCVEAHEDPSFGQAVSAATFRLSDSHVSKSAGSDISTGMRSWLMLCVSSFGSVVMKANTWSTFSPLFFH